MNGLFRKNFCHLQIVFDTRVYGTNIFSETASFICKYFLYEGLWNSLGVAMDWIMSYTDILFTTFRMWTANDSQAQETGWLVWLEQFLSVFSSFVCVTLCTYVWMCHFLCTYVHAFIWSVVVGHHQVHHLLVMVEIVRAQARYPLSIC